MSCENVLFPPQICLSVSCFCLFLKQATCVLPMCTSGRRRHLRGFDRQINYHPNFSAFFQINPKIRERRHEKRHCCVADVMCSGSFGQPLLGWGSLELQEAERSAVSFGMAIQLQGKSKQWHSTVAGSKHTAFVGCRTWTFVVTISIDEKTPTQHI